MKITEADLHLLIADLQDDVTSYRQREAAWLSLITHGVVIALLVLLPKWVGTRPTVVPLNQKQQTTFLSLPDDQLKVKPPKTSWFFSDKNSHCAKPKLRTKRLSAS